jgi:hypothetical protein
MQEHSIDWLYRQIVDETPDAIIFANRDGQIELWNSGAESIFGYSAQRGQKPQPNINHRGTEGTESRADSVCRGGGRHYPPCRLSAWRIVVFLCGLGASVVQLSLFGAEKQQLTRKPCQKNKELRISSTGGNGQEPWHHYPG